MPTPSSDQSPDPPSPQSHAFATCPDDLQTPPRTSWQTAAGGAAAQSQHTDMEVHNESAAAMAVDDSVARAGTSGPMMEESVMVDERTTVAPSSRATTMSPLPQSSITSGSSPASFGLDTDVAKNVNEANGDSLSRATTGQSEATCDVSSGRRSPEQARNAPSRGVDNLETSVPYDDLYAPSMGPDYPSMRVSYQFRSAIVTFGTAC